MFTSVHVLMKPANMNCLTQFILFSLICSLSFFASFFRVEVDVELLKTLDRRVLVYNAVPKTASVTVGTLLAEKAKERGARCFYRILWRQHDNASRHHTEDQLRLLRNALMKASKSRPVLYREEIHFVNFYDDTDSDWSPTYYSQVRHPIDWFASRYAYQRDRK